jgi:hypothetical protein
MGVHGQQRRKLRGLGATVLCGMIAGCAGNGDGLDENGRPIDENPPPAGDDFTVIQDTIFTPICTVCHAGAQAPLGLRLGEGESYAMLVEVPSVEVPELLRVAPGDPDGSYIVSVWSGSMPRWSCSSSARDCAPTTAFHGVRSRSGLLRLSSCTAISDEP